MSLDAAIGRMTERSQKVLELALREALQLGFNYIGPEHILLGLIREGESLAAKALEGTDARTRLLGLLREYRTGQEPIVEPKPDNEMVVGVRRIAGSIQAEPGEPAVGAIRVMWVTIAGEKVPGLIQSTRCENSVGVMEVTVKFICSGYRTADAYGPEAPEGWDE